MPALSAFRGFLLLAVVAVAGCSSDPAEREYIHALEGEETGMSRQTQIAYIDRAIALAPDRTHFWETRGIYHIDLRDYPAAIADLDHAIALGDRSYLRFLRGLAHCQNGAYPRGLQDLDMAVLADPANVQFYRGRELALVEVGRAREALTDGEHLVKIEPQVAASYYVRGKARAALSLHREAIDDFTEAIRRRPELIYPRVARSESYRSIGDSASAESDRDMVSRAIRDHGHCAVCIDPFRY